MPTTIANLHDAIIAVAPSLAGIAIGSPSDKSTWRLNFPTGTSSDQITAAQAVVASFVLGAPTADDVAAERTRRLSLGFSYTFPPLNGQPDPRGTHHIGTTDADMIGWDEVTKATQAMIAVGTPTTTLTIVTNTAPATITALEWQQILIAATAARQPLWAKSFALEAQTPIPSDYTADSHWI